MTAEKVTVSGEGLTIDEVVRVSRYGASGDFPG